MARARPASRSSVSSVTKPLTVAASFRGTFYPAEVDGALAAFIVDLEQEPRKTLPTRITVSVEMTAPTDDGLRSDEEGADLDDLLDQLTSRLAPFRAECVGFYDLRGVTTFVFYAAKASEAAVEKAIGKLAPYAPQILVQADPSWRFYIDALFPDAYAFQGIVNRSTLRELMDHGDELEEPRDIDHVATFPSEALASEAAETLEKASFAVESVGPAEEEGRFAVAFRRREVLDGLEADRFTAQVLDLILPLEGEYDGWSAQAVVAKAKRKAKPTAKAKAKAPAKTKPKAKAKAKATAPAKTKAKAPAKAKAKKATKAKAPAKTKTKAKTKAKRR